MTMSLRSRLTACIGFATLLAPFQALAKCDNKNPGAHLGSGSYTAGQVITELALEPNPEGGYYAETFRDPILGPPGNRSINTAIYYLLEGPDVPSIWHRVDAVEIWHWYAGAPMILHTSEDNGTPTKVHHLGPDVLDGQRPQVVIPGGHWQQAISCGDWTLVGTTVAPGFVPEGSELAPVGWEPNTGE
ncbi:cupin superfamily protein [Poronia punctata]|nr:cupin superfamily protein [Poronia punctata]